MKKLLVLIIALVIVGTIFLFCSGTSNGVGPAPSQAMTMTGTYRVSGDSLYVTMNSQADTSTYCLGDSLEVQIDSAGTSGETGDVYSIVNNTMTLSQWDPYMSGSAYTVDMVATFNRVGMGSGLEGTWKLASEGYAVSSGTAPDSIKRYLDSQNVDFNSALSSGQVSMQYTFSNNQITGTMSSSIDWADEYVKSWTSCSAGSYGMDTCSYNITVVKLSASSVQLKGKTSGETVTVTWNAQGDETFSSSNSAHATGTYYAKPKSCPNDVPTWFSDFIIANAKTALLKRSVRPTVPKQSPLKLWPRFF